MTPYPVQFTRPSVYYDQSDEPPTSPTALSATLERVQGAAENDKHSGQGGGSAAADGSSSSSSAANRLSMMGARRAARGGAAVLDRLRLLTEDYRRQLATYAQLQQDEAHQVATTEFVGAATRSLQARLEAVEAQLQELRPCLTGEAQQQRSS